MKSDLSKIKVYSIGASNENHGPALPKNIDDLFAKRTSVMVCEQTGADYRMHLPYSGDRVGDIAKDWNPGYMGMREVTNCIMVDIRNDVRRQKELYGDNTVIAAIIISGHGGNNFLGDENHIKKISLYAGIPVTYLPPLDGAYAYHPLGKLTPSHADDSEHSIAHYMGVLNQNGLEEIRELAGKNVYKAIKKWPELMGLAGYVLPQAGPKYDKLRDVAPELIDMANTFIKRKYIIADSYCGEELFNKNLDTTIKRVIQFAEKVS